MKKGLALADKLIFVVFHSHKIFSNLALVLMLQSFQVLHAQPSTLALVRPDFYSIEVESTRSPDKPRIVNTWASVFHNGEKYRALMPSETIRGVSGRLDFRWAFGSIIAGESERVELQWRWPNQAEWFTQLLGEGFRDPESGHLVLSSTDIRWGEERSGQIELRFMIKDSSGQIVQDGGQGSILKVQVDSRRVVPSLRFSADWRTFQRGELFAGDVFELEYEIPRLALQFNSNISEDVPWCLFAKIQFDDGPVQSYPLLASNREHPEKVVGIIPTVRIPELAKKMSVWFFSFHNSNSYFDSNFGQNYHFVIRQD